MRNKRLDVLRSVAVLLVLLYHSGIGTRLGNGGWVGVDLFFVLSGFLISGLLFTEYKERGSISFKRFFIRRGLKLYPAFYVYILSMLLYQVIYRRTIGSLGQFLSEMLYIQNYGPFIWRHTWSLAVEEHFYVLLPIFLLFLVKNSTDRANPFQLIPRAFLVVAAACLIIRVATVLSISEPDLREWAKYRMAYATTHCRLDSLFFGVLLGYFHHFRPESLARLLGTASNRIALASFSAVVLSSCLILPIQNRLMLTIGLTLLYLGFGGVLMLCLNIRGILPSRLAKPFDQMGRGFAYLGMYSYSIYLWHTSFLGWGPGMVSHMFHIRLNAIGSFSAYLIISIGFGVLMSRLIEYPVLRARDRLLPAMRSNQTEAMASETKEDLAPAPIPNVP